MRLDDYYSRLVRDGRHGRPTIREVRAEYQRSLERHYSAYLHR